MSKKKREDKQPNQIIVKGKAYWLCVFIVHTATTNGTPQLCKLLLEDDEIELAGGEQFVTAYLPREMVNDTQSKKA